MAVDRIAHCQPPPSPPGLLMATVDALPNA